MIAKLKWLKALWKREINPELIAANKKGSIIYTNITGPDTANREQYKFDLDTNIVTNKIIVAKSVTANPKTAATVKTNGKFFPSLIPLNDKKLSSYNANEIKFIFTSNSNSLFNQTIVAGGAIAAININNIVTTTETAPLLNQFSIVASLQNGLTLTGTNVTLNSSTVGTYSIKLVLTSLYNVNIKTTIFIKIIVEPIIIS